MPSPDILRAIRSLAPFVARMGPAFEALALQKNSGHPDFRFLYGGEGREYYCWQVCIFVPVLAIWSDNPTSHTFPLTDIGHAPHSQVCTAKW